MRILVLASEPITADQLREAIGRAEADEAEVLVVAPALTESPLRFWMSDVDEAIARADSVQEETVAELDAEGIDAAGDTGESDPLLAAEDALATFDADRVVVFHHVEEEQLAGERRIDADELARRLGRQVEERLVGR